MVLTSFNVFYFSVQDEEQDPLLNSFGQLKETLNSIKGMWGWDDACLSELLKGALVKKHTEILKGKIKK